MSKSAILVVSAVELKEKGVSSAPATHSVYGADHYQNSEDHQSKRPNSDSAGEITSLLKYSDYSCEDNDGSDSYDGYGSSSWNAKTFTLHPSVRLMGCRFSFAYRVERCAAL